MLKKNILFLFLLFILVGLHAQPSNDNCANATPVAVPASGNICVNGTLAGATDDGRFSTCENAGSKEVWFTYIANGSNNTVAVSPSGGTPATNLVVTITSSNCATNVFNACNAAPTANGTATANWAFPQGTQVWVFVSSNTGSTGTFQLCITSVNIPPSTGKSCATAAPICDMNSFTAPVAAGSNGFQPPCFSQAMQQPIIFQFTVGQTGLLNWRATPTCGAPNATSTEFDWAVYNITGGCPGTVVACNYNYTGFPFPTTTAQGMQGGPGAGCNNTSVTGSTALEICPGVTVTAGNTYAIMIDQYTPGSTCSINFNFNGSTFVMAPSSVFTVTPTSSCGAVNVTFNNTSIGATSYSWSFGDNTTSTLQNPPVKTYSTPGTYLVGLTATSASGCNDVSSQSVQVFAVPTVNVNSASICSGASAMLTASPSLIGGTFLWSPGGATTSSITVSPATTTSYSVTYTSVDNCTASATGTVSVSSPFTISAGNDTTVCANQTVILNGSVNPAGNYTYQWSPTATLTNANTLNPSATSAFTTTYVLSVTDASNCTKVDSMVVNISGVAVPVNATVTPSLICPGQQVQLNANVTPTGCGPSVMCPGNNLSPSLGSGSTNQPNTAFQGPTILGNFRQSGRNEMLYLASELTTALGGPCVLKTITFDIGIFNSNAWLENFSIKIGCTNATSLSAWDNNLTTVFFSSSPGFQPSAAWGSFVNLTTPFAWDGVSNLIVDVCWNNPITFGNQNNKGQCTNTAFNSYLWSVGNTDQCGGATPPTVSTLRPNIKFNYCFPDINDYNITWIPSNGVNAVSNPSIANPTSNPVNTQNYTISVSSTGCTGTETVTVTVDTSRVSAGPDLNKCPGNVSTLTATVTGAPIPGPPSFTWVTFGGTNVGNTQSVNVNPGSTANYVVTMNGGVCPKRDTVTITVTGLNVTATPTSATCNGANNGKIKATSDGNSPFTYQWSVNANTGNIDSAVNLSPATYFVTVTDATGCSGSASAAITEPTAVSFTSLPDSVNCFGGNDGSIAVSPSGGTGGYTYQWSNGLPPNGTVTSLVANTYSVTVRDANLCSATGSIIVSQPTQIVFGNAQIQNVQCYNGNTGSVIISASGGTGAYSYSWSNNSGLNQTADYALTAGSYTVTVRDANSCTVSATYSVTQPPAGMSLTTNTTPVTCFGGSDGTATVNPSGGTTPYSYQWFPSVQTTPTATGLTAQVYTVIVTDDSLCSTSTNVTVTEPPQISISGNVTDVKCNGGSDGAVDITVTNGVSPLGYAWSNMAVTQNLTNVAQGSYSVLVTDNTGCTQTATYNVFEPVALAINLLSLNNVVCYGANTGSITINVSGGTFPYTYAWNPTGNTSNISSLVAGNYSVVVTDAHSCTATATYQITEPAAPLSFSGQQITDVLCNGLATGSITVNATGGTGAYSYSWSAPASSNTSTASSLIAGNYIVTVADANSCTLSGSYTVNQPPAITFGNQNITNVSCFGYNDGSAQIFPSGGTGGFTYTWNGIIGNNPQTGLVANTYTVVVTDANNCSATTSVVITQPQFFDVSLTAHDALCKGASNGFIESFPIGGTTPYTFYWSDGDTGQTNFAIAAGTYYLTVTDISGCQTIDSATVNEPTQLSFTATATQVKCPGDQNGMIAVVPNGGTAPYNYSATQDNVNFIYSTDGIIVGLASGYYDVIVADGNGCTLVQNVFVPSPLPDVFTYTTDSTSCYGSQYSDGAIHIEGGPAQNTPFTFGVDGSAPNPSGDLYNLTAGSHTANAINNWGCKSNINITIPEPADGIADVYPSDTTIMVGQSVQLTSTFSPFPASSVVSYSWSPKEGLSCIDCPNPLLTTYARQNYYSFTVTYNDHCIATASMTVLVQDTLKVFIPNSFSPNGDGNNDKWLLYGEGIKSLDLKIFNRWGEKVYETNNQFAGWDGTYKGEAQSPSVFVYEVTINFLDDKKISRIGSIMLIR